MFTISLSTIIFKKLMYSRCCGLKISKLAHLNYFKSKERYAMCDVL